MLPTPTRHLQIQFQLVADASEPDQASTTPIPANCRCFQPRPGIYKSNSSKLQMLPTPGYVSANSIPANCRCFRTQDRHLHIQYQQIADTSAPDQASANSYPASCGCFQPRPGICKFISSKLQMLPRPEFTPYMYLQIQFQLVADASDPDQASANSIPANCRYFRPQDMYLQVQYQQIADTSDPDQASANPIPASCGCFRP